MNERLHFRQSGEQALNTLKQESKQAMYRQIKKYLGWRNWAVFNFNSLFENQALLYAILLIRQDYSPVAFYSVAGLLLLSIFATTFGYLINDFFDRDLDFEHGKENTFSDDSKFKAALIVTLFLLLTLLFSWPFRRSVLFIIFMSTWLLISVLYSMPPVRIKERGALGLLLVVMAQRFLPALIVFSILGWPGLMFTALFLFYIFSRGLSSDLNHQISDWKKDLQTKTNTFVVEKGLHRATVLFYFNLVLERLLLSAILVLLFWPLINFPLPIQILHGTVTLFYLGVWVWAGLSEKSQPENPFAPQRSLSQFLHHSFPTVILTLELNLFLIWFQGRFGLLFLLTLIHRGFFQLSLYSESNLLQKLRTLWSFNK
jgi:4-hydroxybenzoate polyprenyltransferase